MQWSVAVRICGGHISTVVEKVLGDLPLPIQGGGAKRCGPLRTPLVDCGLIGQKFLYGGEIAFGDRDGERIPRRGVDQGLFLFKVLGRLFVFGDIKMKSLLNIPSGTCTCRS